MDNFLNIVDCFFCVHRKYESGKRILEDVNQRHFNTNEWNVRSPIYKPTSLTYRTHKT